MLYQMKSGAGIEVHWFLRPGVFFCSRMQSTVKIMVLFATRQWAGTWINKAQIFAVVSSCHQYI